MQSHSVLECVGEIYCRHCNGKEHAPIKLYVPNSEVSITAKALRVTKIREHESSCKLNRSRLSGSGSSLSFYFKGAKINKTKNKEKAKTH